MAGTLPDVPKLFKYKGNLYLNGRLFNVRKIGDTVTAALGEQRVFPTPSVSATPHAATVVAPTIDTTRPGEDDLWFQSDAGASVGGDILPFRWDGNQAYQVATATDVQTTFHTNIGYQTEQIFLVRQGETGTAEGSNFLWYRDFDGDWNAVAVPTLPLPSPGPNGFRIRGGITRYKDENLIIGTATTDVGALSSQHATVLVWDGSSVTVGVQATNPITNFNQGGTGDSTIFRDNFYFPYVDGTTSYIGKYDGSSFSPTFVNATTAFLDANDAVAGIGSIGNYVVVVTTDIATPGNANKAYKTTDFSTWTQLTLENSDLSDTTDFTNIEIVLL